MIPPIPGLDAVPYLPNETVFDRPALSAGIRVNLLGALLGRVYALVRPRLQRR
jgi:hypothetical protein